MLAELLQGAGGEVPRARGAAAAELAADAKLTQEAWEGGFGMARELRLDGMLAHVQHSVPAEEEQKAVAVLIRLAHVLVGGWSSRVVVCGVWCAAAGGPLGEGSRLLLSGRVLLQGSAEGRGWAPKARSLALPALCKGQCWVE